MSMVRAIFVVSSDWPLSSTSTSSSNSRSTSRGVGAGDRDLVALHANLGLAGTNVR
jgi:hypothetical protein